MESNQPNRKETLAAWIFGIAALLTVAALLVHPEESPEDAAQMQIIRDHETAWRTSHWIGSVTLPLLAASGLALLARRSPLAHSDLGAVSLAGLAVFFSLATLVTLIEATVIPNAAIANDVAAFAPWRDFEFALVVPFAFGLLCLGGVAFSQARARPGRFAAAAAIIAGVGGVASFVGLVGTVAGISALHALKMAGLLPLLYAGWLGVSTARNTPAPKAGTARASAA